MSAECSILTRGALDLNIGYRWDKINLFPVGYGQSSLFGYNNRFEKLQSFQLGADLWLAPFHRMYARGRAHYSWIQSGHYAGRISDNISGGYAQDILGGIGYLFCPSPWWKLGLLGGWSYDKIKLDIATVPSFEPSFQWQGPWGGFDFLLGLSSCLRLCFGYELHHALFQSQIFVPGNVSGNDSGRFNHNHFWGNIAHGKLTYLFCNHWSIGLDLRYQIWLAQGRGNYFPDVPRRGFTNIVTDLSWASFSGSFNLGVNF